MGDVRAQSFGPYLGLRDVIDDEEAVGEMLSYFPAREVEEPATKEFVRAEIHAATNRVILWISGANATLTGLVLAITSLS